MHGMIGQSTGFLPPESLKWVPISFFAQPHVSIRSWSGPTTPTADHSRDRTRLARKLTGRRAFVGPRRCRDSPVLSYFGFSMIERMITRWRRSLLPFVKDWNDKYYIHRPMEYFPRDEGSTSVMVHAKSGLTQHTHTRTAQRGCVGRQRKDIDRAGQQQHS